MKVLTLSIMFLMSFLSYGQEIDFTDERAKADLPKIHITSYRCNSFKTECLGLDEKGRIKLKIVSEEYNNEIIVLSDEGKKIASNDDDSQIMSLFFQLEKVTPGQCSLDLYVNGPTKEIKKSRLDCPVSTASISNTDRNSFPDRRPGFSESFIRIRAKAE